jgi:triosephosphate isomerase
MILVNFKLFPQSFGDQAVSLAKICFRVSQDTGVKIYPVVSALDAHRLISTVGIRVYLGHVDEYLSGPKTGYVSALQAQILGIRGSLLNHSEHRLPPGTIRKILKNQPAGFESIVCLGRLGQLTTWAKKLPADYIAYEPRELIGSRHSSVFSQNLSVIKKFLDYYPPSRLIAGAGIHTVADARIAVDLQLAGILVATDVLCSVNPEKELRQLATAFSV